MQLSARNQLKGKVKSIKRGGIMSEVVVTLDKGGDEIVAAITLSSVDRLKLKEGSTVIVVIKSTEVMLATED